MRGQLVVTEAERIRRRQVKVEENRHEDALFELMVQSLRETMDEYSRPMP
jgi:hypothetical protein